MTAGLKPAVADDIDRVRELRLNQSILPLNEILHQLPTKYQGKLLEAELEEEGDGLIIYELELLNQQQQLQHLEVDARSGTIIQVGED